MITAPPSSRASRESFPTEADWIEPLLGIINAQSDALAAVVAQLNAQGGTTELDIDIPATYANAFPKLIANPLTVRAKHVYATAIIERTAPDATTTNETRAVFVEWANDAASDGSLRLKIKNVAGLEVSTNYRITLKVES